MTPPTLSEHWAHLREEGPGTVPGGYRLRLITSGSGVRIYAAVTETALLPAIVMEMTGAVRVSERASSAGRAFEVKLGQFPGLPIGTHGAALELRDHSFEDLFERLGQEIIATIGDDASPAEVGHAISACIERWRSFIERGRMPISEEEVRGLIGELVVLARCIGSLGAAEALRCWVGPLGGVRDFRLPAASVEVKTFQSDTGASLRFNDPQQLDADDARPVHVAAVRLSRHETRGLTLPEMIEHLRSRINSEPATAPAFDACLARYGYVTAWADQLDQHYVAGPVILYRVREDFPRIKTADVPAGVERVHFSVLLAGLRPFLTDATPVLGERDPVIEREEE